MVKRKKKLSKRVYGTAHTVSEDEARFVYEKGCKELIFGTGQYGSAALSQVATAFLEEMGCRVVAVPTPEAIKTFKTEDDPTASAPGTTFITGTRMGLTSTKIHVRWSAATDPSSAITRYELQRSKNDGPWGATRSLAGTTRTITDTVAFDVTYRYRLRAADAAGHWSPWAVAGTSRVHAYDDRSSRVVWKGSWKRVTSWSAFKRTVTGSTKPSATMSMTFTGHSVAIVGPKGRHRGKFTVSIDGVVVKTVSQKSSASSRRVVFAWYSAAGGTHTISIKPTGTGTYRLIRVDAILVGR